MVSNFAAGIDRDKIPSPENLRFCYRNNLARRRFIVPRRRTTPTIVARSFPISVFAMAESIFCGLRCLVISAHFSPAADENQPAASSSDPGEYVSAKLRPATAATRYGIRVVN
jgi:hypothetical protein